MRNEFWFKQMQFRQRQVIEALNAARDTMKP
jgi:hypothetical protein